ncbi:MAG TPA: TolC family protein [Polyangia bacterium]
MLAAEAAPTPPAPAAAKTLTLAEAETTALKHAPTLEQAYGQAEAAEGRLEQARSGYLPQLNATGTYQRTTANFVARPGFVPTNTMICTMPNMTNCTPPPANNGWGAPLFNFFTFGATATQLIYDFGVTRGKWRSAEASRDAANWNRRAIENQTLLAVRRAFFQGRTQRDLVSVADDGVHNQEKHLEQSVALVKAGIRPEIDTATVRTALANAKVQLVNAQSNYFVAQAQLAQAMGISVDGVYALADDDLPAIDGEDGPNAPLTDRALKARPELANLANQREAQALLTDAVRGGYGPSLGAVANATESGSAIDRLVPNWYVGLQLSWAIFQGGLTHGQVREQKGNLIGLDGQVAALRLQVEVDVEQGRLAVQAAKATITAAEEALVNARDQLTLAEARYRQGLGSVIELDDAQVAYTTAAAQEVQAKYGLAAARAQLLAALGAR